MVFDVPDALAASKRHAGAGAISGGEGADLISLWILSL